MNRLTMTLAASFAALAASAGSAFAAGPVQSTTQSSGTGQTAAAASSATQVSPSNQNISVRVLSPGSNGDVVQSNSASSSANAANTAATTQNAGQTQGSSGCGCSPSPVQALQQAANTGQLGSILSAAQQLAGSNTAGPTSVASSGSGAPTSQSNGASSSGSAANTAPTAQNASQAQSGGGGDQAAQQTASTKQDAQAASSVKQDHPSNSNISVRVLSPGNDGSVSQSNSASSTATAGNSASTTQNAPQVQSGGSGVQAATQNAQTAQKAGAASSTEQDHPSNSNVSVRVLSPGDDGSVSQSNDAKSAATATNSAPVTQTAGQSQTGTPCGCSGSGPAVQAIGQNSSVEQAGVAESRADQIGASNSNDPVRIWSSGGGGDVTQSNNDSSTASATNTAPVTQSGSQQQTDPSCGCTSDSAVQALGQSGWTGQAGLAASSAQQVGAANADDPVRIWSDGNDGAVSQSNDADSAATTSNNAATTQQGGQTQSGSGVQALGQDAKTWQAGLAGSSVQQMPGEDSCGCGSSFGNSARPVRIGSNGDDGTLSQSNDASSNAATGNDAMTSQTGTQAQAAPSCGCSGPGVQALGQEALTEQLAEALSSAWQIGASNSSDPVRVWSLGGGGSTRQSNTASSGASGRSLGQTGQSASQAQIGAPMIV